MMINRVELKGEAKNILRSAQVSPYLMALLFLVLRVVLEGLRGYVSGDFITYINNIVPGFPIPDILIHDEFDPKVVIFIVVMAWLLSSVLNAGWSLYHLGIRKGEKMGFGTLFDGFSFVGKLILTSLAVNALVTLGTTLFIIPGVIISYMYRYAVYNLCENPDISVLQAMRMSAHQTRGFKMQLFVLDWSFLGWQVVSAFTFGIAAIWVLPYAEQTNVGYFQELKRASGVGYRSE